MRLTKEVPYPAALEDCYAALEYLWDHADELSIDRDKKSQLYNHRCKYWISCASGVKNIASEKKI